MRVTTGLLTLLLNLAPAQIYVDASATGNNIGTSWTHAYTCLQDALAVAQPGDEVWVATGIYRPDQGANQVPLSRAASFTVPAGVTVRGGFAGNEASLVERAGSYGQTILSGDLFGNDSGFVGNDENSYHVVRGTPWDDESVLDGFTITGGNANGLGFASGGGGVLLLECGMRLVRCVITQNHATATGGGVHNIGGVFPSFLDCVVSGNRSDGSGGGLATNGTLSGCAIVSNTALVAGGLLGSPSLYDCVLEANTAVAAGGALQGSPPAIERCTFRCNMVTVGANPFVDGGGALRLSGSPTITHSTFHMNYAQSRGGAIMTVNGTVLDIRDCRFDWNTADDGGAIRSQGTLSLSRCVFLHNVAGSRGGAITGDINAENCTLVGNTAGVDGGALHYSQGILRACVFDGNIANRGGALFTHQALLAINCTMHRNSAFASGGGVYSDGGAQPELVNSIIWDTLAGGPLGGASALVDHCDIPGVGTAMGNFNADPLFIDPIGPDGIPSTGDENLQLQPGSPCVDAGKLTAVPAPSDPLRHYDDVCIAPVGPSLGGSRNDIGAYGGPAACTWTAPPLAPTYPGSGGILELRTGVDGAATAQPDVKTAPVGSSIQIDWRFPGGHVNYSWHLLAAQHAPSGASILQHLAYADVWVLPLMSSVLYLEMGMLPSASVTLHTTTPPLAGDRIILQALWVSLAAPNGLYASSDAHEFVIVP